VTLKGKTAIITGAAWGIGKATALCFAREGAGLTLVDLNAAALADVETACRECGARVVAVARDAADLESMEAFVQATADAFGGIDILVNSVAHRVVKPFLEVQPDELLRTLTVNVAGVFLLIQRVVPHMLARGGGSIVNISSQIGFVGAPNFSAYCTAKGAVINMTRTLALEFASQNIRVNSVAPGATETEGARALYRADPEILKARLADVPMGRLGRPEEIAEACLFLASERASYVTGHILVADGGFLIH
jgi:NAD(P)-dependent dehydrogenase (short-subunit alcohol dehydrogenase family)